jgi:DNA-binding MarR family transcriptional regulator
MPDLEDAALRLRMAFRLIIRRAQAVSGQDAPTRSEQDVMSRLDENGAMTPGALAAAMRVKPQTMGQTLDLLDRHKWIVRAPHPTDRRRILIALSPAGHRIIARGRAARQSWLTGELSLLTPAHRKTLLQAIPILERIARSEPISSTPSKP